MPEFYMILARKINQILEFYTIFFQKMPEFCIIIARKKIFSRFFLGGGGHVSSLPPSPSPTPMNQSVTKLLISSFDISDRTGLISLL